MCLADWYLNLLRGCRAPKAFKWHATRRHRQAYIDTCMPCTQQLLPTWSHAGANQWWRVGAMWRTPAAHVFAGFGALAWTAPTPMCGAQTPIRHVVRHRLCMHACGTRILITRLSAQHAHAGLCSPALLSSTGSQRSAAVINASNGLLHHYMRR